MSRKRRAPPPPPPQESSSEESGSVEEEEEEPPSHPARRMPPPAAAADGADSSEGSGSDSDSDTDAQAFQMRQLHHFPTKLPPHLVPQPASHAAAAADDDDEGESSESESEPENPEPVVQKKAAAAGKSKAEQERKRPAADPAPSGKAKKAKAGAEKAAAPAEATPPGKAKKGKAESEKAAPEAPPAGKAKKGKAEQEKVVPEATPASKVKKGKAEGEKAASEDTPSVKGKKGGGKLEKPGVLDSSPSSSKPEKLPRAQRLWTKNDEMKVLEALAGHVKSDGTLPKTDFLLATVGDRLDRKNCTYSDIYEKVRQLKGRYEKAVSTGIVPSKEDELQIYKLSEAVWGEKAKEALAAARSQNDGAVTKSKKGQSNKQKVDGNSKGGTPKEAAASTASQNGDSQKGSKKGQAIKEKTDRDVKSRLSKEATATGTPSKSKKWDNQNEELDKDAKSGDLGKSKREKTDKGKKDIDRDSLKSKEAAAANQNGGTLTKNKEGETHDDEVERDANVEVTRRGFDELQGLYSNLAAYVEEIEAQNPCGETLKRAFEFIGDEKAQSLEYKVKRQRVSEAKAQLRRADVKKDVLNTLMSLVD
ncbi:hypothetical protein SEVIR_1G130300v4 [Setaria viridis]|uniref:Glabrous enhancer-binding protein-like DBD domain-containing protein n=1 Tax=Setaria viridis TaxID=4556 RepID=A0A4U6WA64_SETVI|nr:nucleolar protein dao-5-like [Setaria viridis]TKW38664.1 hypothetical protein SEVIR_1G130300v2 [Setaria viridis]